MADINDRRRIDDGRYVDDRRRGEDRRRGPDTMRLLLPFFAVTSWICVAAAFFVLSLAKPATYTFIGLFSKQPVYSGWDMELLNYVFWLLFSALVLGVSGFIINMMRNKRKNDSLYVSLVLGGFFAFVLLLLVFNL